MTCVLVNGEMSKSELEFQTEKAVHIHFTPECLPYVGREPLARVPVEA